MDKVFGNSDLRNLILQKRAFLMNVENRKKKARVCDIIRRFHFQNVNDNQFWWRPGGQSIRKWRWGDKVYSVTWEKWNNPNFPEHELRVRKFIRDEHNHRRWHQIEMKFL